MRKRLRHLLDCLHLDIPKRVLEYQKDQKLRPDARVIGKAFVEGETVYIRDFSRGSSSNWMQAEVTGCEAGSWVRLRAVEWDRSVETRRSLARWERTAVGTPESAARGAAESVDRTSSFDSCTNTPPPPKIELWRKRCDSEALDDCPCSMRRRDVLDR